MPPPSLRPWGRAIPPSGIVDVEYYARRCHMQNFKSLSSKTALEIEMLLLPMPPTSLRPWGGAIPLSGIVDVEYYAR